MRILVSIVLLAGCGTYTGTRTTTPCVKVVGSHLCRAAAPKSVAGGLRDEDKKAQVPAAKEKR